MPRSKKPWFRFYVETLWDSKIRRLSIPQRWLWVAVLGCARSSPLPGWLYLVESTPMTVKDIADAASLSPNIVRVGLSVFEDLGLVGWDEEQTAWFVVRWNERQFESDEVAVRTAKHRRRNVPTSSVGTSPENRGQKTDTEGLDTSPPPPRVLQLSIGDGGGGEIELTREAMRAEGIPDDVAEEAISKARIRAVDGKVSAFTPYALQRARTLMAERERARSERLDPVRVQERAYVQALQSGELDESCDHGFALSDCTDPDCIALRTEVVARHARRVLEEASARG